MKHITKNYISWFSIAVIKTEPKIKFMPQLLPKKEHKSYHLSTKKSTCTNKITHVMHRSFCGPTLGPLKMIRPTYFSYYTFMGSLKKLFNQILIGAFSKLIRWNWVVRPTNYKRTPIDIRFNLSFTETHKKGSKKKLTVRIIFAKAQGGLRKKICAWSVEHCLCT